jgi:hypothetical protein
VLHGKKRMNSLPGVPMPESWQITSFHVGSVSYKITRGGLNRYVHLQEFRKNARKNIQPVPVKKQ